MSGLKQSRALLVLLLALVLSFPGVPEPTGYLSVSFAYADDDDGDDGDDGGGGTAGRGVNSGGGGGARSMRRSRGAEPRFFRYLRRQLSPGRPRHVRPRQARRSAPRGIPVQHSRPNEIVVFGIAAAQLDQLASLGFQVIERNQAGQDAPLGELVRLAIPSGMTDEAAVAQARAAAPGAAVDLNHLYRPSEAGDCGGRPCVAPSLVGWPVASQSACRGNGVTIGLIDTAINPQHPTFAGSRLEVIRLGKDTAQESGRQHGTAVAALLVGRARGATPGLVPDARLIAVDAFERGARNDQRADAYTLARAIDMLTTRRVDVLNMSLAGPQNTVLERFIGTAHGKDIVLVAAAGNAGPRADPVFPAAYPGVIAVTAIDRQKKVYRRANRGEHVDLAAPGVNVWTAASVKGARPKTGTSFAAPFVTAAAALAKASGTTGAANIEQRLTRAAMDLGDSGRDDVFGWGLLNVSEICAQEG